MFTNYSKQLRKMNPLIKSVGIISISTTTAALCVDGGGLSVSLSLTALFTGLGFCYYRQNPYQVLKNLDTQISKLVKEKIELSDELQELSDKELAIASIEELENLLDKKHIELQEIEKQYRKQWDIKQNEINQQQQNNEKFLEEKLVQIDLQLTERSQELEQRELLITQQVEEINQELEIDKKQFLEEHNRVIASYEDEIVFLKEQLREAESEIKRYDFPRMPEGVSREDIAARRIIEILRDCKLICDFRGAWIENGFILVRVRPRRGGEKEISKWANRLQIELSLEALPEISTQSGAVQLRLMPNDMPYIPLPNEPINSDDEPNGDRSEPLHQFVEPNIILDPHGPIRPLERRWVLWLWTIHNPPLNNKANVIRRVWGATNGGKPEKFRAARERLHQILNDANIKYRVRKKA